jgi:hypothetical protein
MMGTGFFRDEKHVILASILESGNTEFHLKKRENRAANLLLGRERDGQSMPT